MKGRSKLGHPLMNCEPLILEGEVLSHSEWENCYLAISGQEIENAIIRHFFGISSDELHPAGFDPGDITLGRMRITVELIVPAWEEKDGDYVD